jgi:hypothetical protein
MGLAWTVGCVAFGLIVVRNSVECRIARQYLCQASVFMCGVSILALTTVHGHRQGYVMFAWVYGVFCGGYNYSLKMYTYERVRARNFARTWGFVQCSQAIPIALGVPISGEYDNERVPRRHNNPRDSAGRNARPPTSRPRCSSPVEDVPFAC